MDTAAEVRGETIEDLAPCAGDSNRRALGVEARAILPPIGPVAPVINAFLPLSSNITSSR